MPSSTLTKNGEEAEEVELEFPIDELRVALGVTELEAENAALRELLSELLTYVGYVDLSLQELQGEATVTERLKYNVNRGGRLQFQRERPPAPGNLTKTKLALVTEAKRN